MKNQIQKILIPLLLLIAGTAIAQQKDTLNYTQLQIQLQQAQAKVKQIMGANSDSLNAALARGQVKAAIGAAKGNSQGAQIPDSVTRMGVGMFNIPDPSKIISNTNANMVKNMTAMRNMQSQLHQRTASSIPQKGTAGFSAIAVPNRQMITNMARMMLAQAIPKLKQINMTLQRTLDDLLQDTTITPQAEALLQLSKGAPMPVVQYLACKGVITEPYNPWSSNMLGLVYRNLGDNKSAVQCYTYAYALYPCPLIRCNLAWATAYFGDFTAAKKYFNSVLSTLPDYASAWEGLGMMAYQQGDIQTLFQCLAHQIKTAGPAGDNGAGDDLARFCGGVVDEQSMANVGRANTQSNPMNDHSQDPADDEDGDNQDPPAGGDSSYPTFPELGGIFAQNMEDLPKVVPLTAGFNQMIISMKKKAQAKVDGLAAGLSKMKEEPYMDDQGMKVTPFRYSKFVIQFHGVEALFNARVTYVMANFYKEYQRLIMSMAAQGFAFSDYVTSTYRNAGSGHTAQYDDTLNCQMKPRARSELGSNFSGSSDIFTRYYVQLKDQCNWFISASTSSIKHMLKPDWNTWMNAVRENDIQQAVLGIFQNWLILQTASYSPSEANIAFYEPCPATELRMMDASGGKGPDKPKKGDLKPYKTPPGPCNGNMTDLHKDWEHLKIDVDCHSSRVAIYPIVLKAGGGGEVGGFKASASVEARLGLVYKQTNATATSAAHSDWGSTLNVNADASLKGNLAESLGPASVSGHAGVEVKGNADFDSTWRFDTEGGFIGKAKSADFDFSLTVDGKMAMNAPLIGEHSTGVAWMAEAHGKIDAVSAADSGYKVTDLNFDASTKTTVDFH